MTARIVSYAAALADLCLRYELAPPEFEVVTVTGPPHDPVFVMKGRAGEHEVQASASKKQTAKQEAAKLLLIKMGEIAEEDVQSAENDSLRQAATVLGHIVDDGVNMPKRVGQFPKMEGREDSTPIPPANLANPVGDLIELATIMGWPSPIVTDEDRTGPAHDPRFTVSCFFQNHKTLATAPSKKDARRWAALEMHDHIRHQPDVIFKYCRRHGIPVDNHRRTAKQVSSSGPFEAVGDAMHEGESKLPVSENRGIFDKLKLVKDIRKLQNPEGLLGCVMKELNFGWTLDLVNEDMSFTPIKQSSPSDAYRDIDSDSDQPLSIDTGSTDELLNEDEVSDNDSLREPVAQSEQKNELPFTVRVLMNLSLAAPVCAFGQGKTLDRARVVAARNTLECLRTFSVEDGSQ